MAENDQMNRAVCDACAFEGEDDDDYKMGRMAERRADFLYVRFGDIVSLSLSLKSRLRVPPES